MKFHPMALIYPSLEGKANPLSFAHATLISGAIDGSIAVVSDEDQRKKLRQVGCFGLSFLNKQGTAISTNSVIFLNRGRDPLGEEAILCLQEFVLDQVGENERVLGVPIQKRIPPFRK